MIDLRKRRIFFLTIGQLAGQCRSSQCAFTDDLARLSRRIARTCGIDSLADDFFRHSRILLKKLAELFVQERFDRAFDGRIQFAFRLSFKLRLRNFDGDDGDQTFANVVAGQSVLLNFSVNPELSA